ncbi:metallophosphoesterase [Candidatus Pacearchaeota archaeon]|nr:metallophosphoesterase [Candidatus Pacearchaeota archaeon]
MANEILKFCLEKGVLLDRETYNLFSDFDEETAKKIIEKFSGMKEKIITKSFIANNAEKIESIIGDKKIIEKLRINFGITLEISRESYVEEPKKEKATIPDFGNIKVIYSLANISKKIEPMDFVRHFRNRYSDIRRILQERKELDNLTSIDKMSGERQVASVIGMVLNKRITKNKNIFLNVEDLTGNLNVLVSKDKGAVYDIAKEALVDDIVGIRGFGNNEVLFANDILYPDSFLQEKAKIERDEKAAFISDIHIGSRMFLENNFKKFIKWINGEEGDEKQREEAKKVKYLFITGDTIDGVGIFPGQEDLLTIKDIREQYKVLASYLKQIRKEVKIIVCPGQHDSVRVAEPQPFIGRDYGEALYELDNVILVSNPAFIEIMNSDSRGIKILMYHGASMNSFIGEIEELRIGKAHDYPTRVVKHLLKRRHLATLHSAVTYIPSQNSDPLVIKEVPDIINTADLHKPDIDSYNNVLIICSSCWQSMTPFEEKVGNHPDPCKVPVLNLKTREIKILDFSDAPENKTCEEKEKAVVCSLDKSGEKK